MHGWLVRLKKPTTEYSKTTGGPSERMSDEQKRAFLAKALSCDILDDEEEEVEETDGEEEGETSQKKGKGEQLAVAEAGEQSEEVTEGLDTEIGSLSLVSARKEKVGEKRKSRNAGTRAKRIRRV